MKSLSNGKTFFGDKRLRSLAEVKSGGFTVRVETQHGKTTLKSNELKISYYLLYRRYMII